MSRTIRAAAAVAILLAVALIVVALSLFAFSDESRGVVRASESRLREPSPPARASPARASAAAPTHSAPTPPPASPLPAPSPPPPPPPPPPALSFWEAARAALGKLLFGANEAATTAVVPPTMRAADEWSSLDWTPAYPLGMNASAWEEFKRELYNVSIDLMSMPSVDRQMWGLVFGPEYMGNTRERIRVHEHRGVRLFVKVQSESKQILEGLEMVDPITQISLECGFHKIMPLHWVGTVSGARAVFGVHRDGLTIERLRAALRPSYGERMSAFRELLRHVRPWQPRLFAIMDVLLSFADRHSGNVIVTEEYDLVAIDSYQNALIGRVPFVDSIFVPLTEVYAIHRLGWAKLFTSNPEPPVMPADPTLTLDYRCSSFDRRVGFDFPPVTERCMRRFAASDVATLARELGLSNAPAQWLVEQSSRMLSLGLEQACHQVAQLQMQRNGGNLKVGNKRFLFYSFEPCCVIVDDKCKLSTDRPDEHNSTRPGRLD